jgi:hypothetical protein
LYRESLNENLIEINQLLKEKKVSDQIITDRCKEVLSLSCENIVKKWKVGRKYLRTLFVKEAFAGFYPQRIIKTSIYIDAIINILDDLLDEKMNEKEKKFYVLEFLRVFSVYNYEYPQREIQACLGNYFNKLISLAVVEDYYEDLIENEKEINKIAGYSIEVLNCRSMDIDIFNELVILSSNCYSHKEKEKIKELGRMFRAVNIMKKDIADIEYDRKTEQESVISKMAERKDCDFCKYVLFISNYYLSKAEKIKLKESTNKSYAVPVSNFYNMIQRDKDKIIELVAKYHL